ncbi:MAG TPA: hypothetical protein VHG91_00845 [Longimicrobium sp.]|nr:hypothetical protein [Longimicrobium sp.]
MTVRKIRAGLFAAAVAASLGFGGAQALAAPASFAQTRGCTPESCQKKCQTQHGVDGFCTGRGCWCLTE